MSDEPVAYLGGDQGQAPESAEPPPPAEDEVDGYLGGSSAEQAPVEEELPSLPPQESAGNYSAQDFLDPAAEAPAEDPYADPYAQQPGAPEQGYGDYEGYDSAAVEQSDPAYFDSMAHGSSTEAAPPAEEYGAEGDDPDQPKTISQQDAESIIRRITTKRILPPESGEKKPIAPPPPKLTEAGGGLRVWPILFVMLVIGGMGVGIFGKEIRDQFPFLEPYMPWLDPIVVTVTEDKIDRPDPNQVAKKKLLDMVLLSEAKAFGVPVKDVPAASALPKAGGTDGGTGSGSGGGPGTGSETSAPGGTTTGGRK